MMVGCEDYYSELVTHTKTGGLIHHNYTRISQPTPPVSVLNGGGGLLLYYNLYTNTRLHTIHE